MTKYPPLLVDWTTRIATLTSRHEFASLPDESSRNPIFVWRTSPLSGSAFFRLCAASRAGRVSPDWHGFAEEIPFVLFYARSSYLLDRMVHNRKTEAQGL